MKSEKAKRNNRTIKYTPEEREQFEENARAAALRLASVAVERNDPCGLGTVLDALFGSEKDLCRKNFGGTADGSAVAP